LIFKLFSKGDQLKIKLANLIFFEIGSGRLFLVFGGRLVLGGREYSECGMSKMNSSFPTSSIIFQAFWM